MKIKTSRFDVLSLLMVSRKPLEDNEFLASTEEEYHHSSSLMKLCVLALVIIGLITFYCVQAKPISLSLWIINTCLLLAFVLYMYFKWGKGIIFPTFLLALNKNKIYPGDEVRVNFTTKGDLSVIQEVTLSLVLQERIIQEYQLSQTLYNDFTVWKKHDAYREVFYQSSKIDVADLCFKVPKHYPPTFQTNHMQMANVKTAKKKNHFIDFHRNVNLFLEWSILIEAKAKSGGLLRRYYFFTVSPFEVSRDDNKNNFEHF